MAGKTAGVVGVVVILLAVVGLVAGSRIPDLQLIPNLVRVPVLARPANVDPAVDVWGAGTEVHLELEIRIVVFGGEPAAGPFCLHSAVDNLPFCFALGHKVVQGRAVKEQFPACGLFLGGERVGQASLRRDRDADCHERR